MRVCFRAELDSSEIQERHANSQCRESGIGRIAAERHVGQDSDSLPSPAYLMYCKYP